MSKDDELAYPSVVNGVFYAGLTKRELFAAMAMQGLLSNAELEPKNPSKNVSSYSHAAVIHADYLLAELAKEATQ